MIIDYFEKVRKKLARLKWLIDREVIETEYDEDVNLGIIGGTITFKDGTVLNFKEIISLTERNYRFHYMDKENRLIYRWDSAPHHKEVKTFPYHLHTSRGVVECKLVSLVDVLSKIENIIVDHLEK